MGAKTRRNKVEEKYLLTVSTAGACMKPGGAQPMVGAVQDPRNSITLSR